MRTGVWLLLLAGLVPMAAAQESFQDWAQSQREGFQEFREQRDKAFHQFLKKEWQAFQMYKGKVEDATPKPDTIPKAPASPEPGERSEGGEAEPAHQDEPNKRMPRGQEGPSDPAMEAKSQAGSEPEPEPKAKPEGLDAPGPESQSGGDSKSEPTVGEAPEPTPEPKAIPEGEGRAEPEVEPEAQPSPQATSTQPVEVAFLGHDLRIRVPETWSELNLAEANKQGVANFWADFAKSDVGAVTSQLQETAQRLALNDWGYLKFGHALAKAMHNDGGTALATVWGLLLKSGYDARLGFQNNRLVLLYNSKQKLFDLPYFDLDGKRYYVYPSDRKAQQLRTYKGDYQGAEQRLTVALERPPKVAGGSETRTLRFHFEGQDYAIEVPVSKGLIEYFDSIPQMELATYFRYRPSTQIQEALVGQLKEATKGMAPKKQVDFLLRFVQKSFDYETDQEQFGQENYLLPEETLFQTASDCEDRSVLFAFLVRQVLGLEVAVLDYPGHVATAVHLPDAEQGAHVQLNGQKLIVADPTYINANAGMIMPDFSEKKPQLIPLWQG